MKVMVGRDSECVCVLILDDDVGHRGFHDVVLVGRTEDDVPYVAVSDLSALRQQWTDCGAPTGLCTLCGKVIRLDMFRYVANNHLELGQLWRCPVSWCTQWKGTHQDCIDHIRLVHSVPVTVKAGNLGRCLPPWTVTRDMWRVALKATVSGVSRESLLISLILSY